MTKKCLVCKKEFTPLGSNASRGMGKFCSLQCSYKGRKKPRYWLGKERSEETKLKISASRKGNVPDELGAKNPYWKGNKVGYHGLHTWVNRNFTRPSNCERCGKPDTGKRKFEWANKVHDYTRERKGWLYLCKPCHIKYDIEHNNRPNNY